MHLNDSKKDFGTRVDRHDNIGTGFLGDEAFEILVNDSRFDNMPLILETPEESLWEGGDQKIVFDDTPPGLTDFSEAISLFTSKFFSFSFVAL